MKNLMKLSLSLGLAALLATGSVFAEDTTDDDTGEAKIKVIGHVPLICTITGQSNDVADLGHNPKKGKLYLVGAVGLKCNSKTGATVSLSGLNKGFLMDGSDDHKLNYEAWFKIAGLENGGEANAELFATDGVETGGEVNLPKDKMLAMGRVGGKIIFQLQEQAKFSGNYNEVLVVNIKAST